MLCNARKVTAQKYGIKEDDCTSCMLACCCPGCTLIQVVNQARFSPSEVARGCADHAAAPASVGARTHRALPTRSQILVKENATWGCCSVSDSAGAPETQEMER